MRPRARWAVAAVPTLFAALLIRHAASDDAYVGNGSSYWETHSDGRAFVVIAVLLDAAAAVIALRSRWWASFPSVLVALFATLTAWVVVTAN